MTVDLASPADVRRRFDEHDYLADDGISAAVFLSLRLGLPLLLEGEPGVGKTAAARGAGRRRSARPLIRLQCYEGLTAGEALYDWNYQRQLLAIRLAESQHQTLARRRPVQRGVPASSGRSCRCVRYDGPTPPVLLIDEIDRADDEFEALLLEFLGEGVGDRARARHVHRDAARRSSCSPRNRSRELHDALRRRCLYHWIEYPEPQRVVAILRRTVPAASRAADRVGHAVRRPRACARRRQAARCRRGDRLGGRARRARRRPSSSARSCSPPSARSPRRPTTVTSWSPRSTTTRSADRCRRCWQTWTGRPSWPPWCTGSARGGWTSG